MSAPPPALNQELAELLMRHKTQRMVFVPNPGNAGDSLITCATYVLFKQLRLDFEIGSHTATYPGRFIIYAGGGNLVANYDDAIQFIRKNHSVSSTLVVLPHTIAAHAESLANLAANVHLFCRDFESFQYCRQAGGGAKIHLAHDMAVAVPFAAVAAQINAAKQSGLLPSTPWWMDARYRSLALKQAAKLQFLSDTLNAFRTDSEKTPRKLPFGNVDVSDLFSSKDFGILGTMGVVSNMVSFLAPYSVVHTNRLHLCILAAWIGKEVRFEGNSYFKNRAIFEHSLRGQFPNVIWNGA
jgi:exopolysaccharide biosynthesis predicted pyruvyltransferase EpsI